MQFYVFLTTAPTGVLIAGTAWLLGEVGKTKFMGKVLHIYGKTKALHAPLRELLYCASSSHHGEMFGSNLGVVSTPLLQPIQIRPSARFPWHNNNWYSLLTCNNTAWAGLWCTILLIEECFQRTQTKQFWFWCLLTRRWRWTGSMTRSNFSLCAGSMISGKWRLQDTHKLMASKYFQPLRSPIKVNTIENW